MVETVMMEGMLYVQGPKVCHMESDAVGTPPPTPLPDLLYLLPLFQVYESGISPCI